MAQMEQTLTQLDQLLQHHLTTQAHSSTVHQDQQAMHPQVLPFQL